MTKTLIAVPCMDMVYTDFFEAIINLQRPEGTYFTVTKNTLIYVARNMIAANAIEHGFDRVMWFDSDVVMPPDTLIKLSADMDKGIDFVSGVYFTRRPPVIKPVTYSGLWHNQTKTGLDAGAVNYWEYPNTLTECAGVGFGCAMTSTALLTRIGQKFGSPFTPMDGLGEDLSFCMRCIQAGEKIFIDPEVKCGHVGAFQFNEDYYRKQGKPV